MALPDISKRSKQSARFMNLNAEHVGSTLLRQIAFSSMGNFKFSKHFKLYKHLVNLN